MIILHNGCAVPISYISKENSRMLRMRTSSRVLTRAKIPPISMSLNNRIIEIIGYKKSIRCINDLSDSTIMRRISRSSNIRGYGIQSITSRHRDRLLHVIHNYSKGVKK